MLSIDRSITKKKKSGAKPWSVAIDPSIAQKKEQEGVEAAVDRPVAIARLINRWVAQKKQEGGKAAVDRPVAID